MPRFLRAMHTPSKAWTRSRVPSTTLTLTRRVSPGREVRDRPAVGAARDLLLLELLNQVHGILVARRAGADRAPSRPVVSTAEMARPQIRAPAICVIALGLLAGARRGSLRGGRTAAPPAPRAPPRPAAGCSGGIPAGRAAKLSSASEAAPPTTPGSSRTQASIRAIAAARRPTARSRRADLLEQPRASIDPLVDALEAAAQEHDAGAGGKRAHARLGQRRAARREIEQRAAPRRCAAPRRRARGHHVRAHHHAGAAAERRVVDGLVAVGGEVAQVDRLERQRPSSQRPAGQRMAERPREHLGEQGEHGRRPGRGRGSRPPPPRRSSARRLDHERGRRARSTLGHGPPGERQAQHAGRRRPATSSMSPAPKLSTRAPCRGARRRRAARPGLRGRCGRTRPARGPAGARAARTARCRAAPRRRCDRRCRRPRASTPPRRAADHFELEQPLAVAVVDRAVGGDVLRRAR